MYKVYLISCGDIDKEYKIGFTKRKVEDRIKSFKTGNSNTFEIVSVFESKWGSKIEAFLHRKFSCKNLGGEWFRLSEEEVKNFYKTCEYQHNIFELINNENTYIIERGGLK